MNPEARKLLDKSGRAIHAAEVLLREGDTDFAVGRAYYAMFYAVQALLVGRGHRFSKHGAVHAAFGEQFAKTGLLDSKYHRWLLEAFNARIAADYNVEAGLPAEAAATVIARAREFLEQARRFLERNP